MCEKTRCEVEEPILTPTLTSFISSSSVSVRPVLEKKIRPSPMSLRDRADLRAGHVPVVVHAVLDAGLAQRLGIFRADERGLHRIGDGGAALVEIDGAVIGMCLAGRPGLAARCVGAEPGGEAERLLRHAEMLMEPARAAR